MLLGQIEDNFGLLFFLRFAKLYGSDFVNIVSKPFSIPFNINSSSEPLFLQVYFWFSKYIDSFDLYNFFVLLLFILNAVAAYKLISYFISNKLVSLYLATLFTFSPYFLYQYRSHLQLLFVFMVILSILTFIKHKRTVLLFPITVLTLTLISNYLAFFSLVTYTLYMISFILINFLQEKKFNTHAKEVFLTYAKSMTVYVLLLSLTVLVLELTHINNFIFRNDEVVSTTQQQNVPIPNRTIEEFFHFTSRPWYFFLPSPENPILGDLTTFTISKLQTTNYFLFNNHFPSEHTASYLGIVNIIFALVGLYAVFKTDKYNDQKRLLYSLVLLSFFISLIMMPPYVSIAGIKIYMPSYVFSKVFSMFRVLTRLGVINLLITLIFTGIGYTYLLEKFRASGKMVFARFLFIIPFSLSFVEFWIPVVVSNTSSPPQVFRYLESLNEKGSIIVYPFEHANSTLIWHETHKMPAFNSKYSTIGLDPREFTNNLFQADQIYWAKQRGAKYLIIFGQSGLVEADLSNKLSKLKTFDSESVDQINGNALYKVINVGPHEKATLYKIN